MSSAKSLPQHASVVVIGGGAMGCSTLYHLAKNGVSDAILIERNQLTSGTTWHSAAQVRSLRSTKNLTELIKYSIELYKSLEEETGQKTGWINKGSIAIATTPDRIINLKRQEALSHLFGVRAESISQGEALERWPHMNADDVIGAVWSPGDGRVSPSDLCAALVKGAKNRGAKIFEQTHMLEFITENNKIKGVVTNKGTIKCDAIALCTGLWSREETAKLGIAAPVWPCEHFYLLTKPIAGIAGNLPTLADNDNHLYIRDDSGGLLVGCFEPMGKAISPEIIGKDSPFQLLPEDWEHFEPMIEKAMHRLPILEQAEIKTLLNGPESFTPDNMFILGEMSETKGVFLGCGMNSIGVASAGGAGMALAHAIQHGHTPNDLSEADPLRFAPEFNSIDILSQRVPEVLGKHYAIAYPYLQMKTSRFFKCPPLTEQWQKHDAHFGQFFGFERPFYFNKKHEPVLTFGKPDYFDNVKDEVMQAHQTAGIFDASPFGKVDVKGKDACKFLNRVLTNQVDKKNGRIIYTAMLNERGTFESDLVCVRLADDKFRLYLGANKTRKDYSWLKNNLEDEQVSLEDVSADYAIMALMGPDVRNIMQKLGGDELLSLKYFSACETMIGTYPILGARLSYVGEDGWEITCQKAHALPIFQLLYEQGAKPSGLLAQTSMRIEKRFLAYGHELDKDVTPFDVGLENAVAWDKDFIGKEALLAKRDAGKIKNRVFSVKFTDDEAVPLGNEPVLYDGKMVGRTTSASYGYRVGAPIALADLHIPDDADNNVQVNIAGELWNASISKTALFDAKGRQMRSR